VPQASGQSAFQLRVQLKRVDPVVWRRLLVPGRVHLGKLDLMIQAAMGWTNSHLHCFRFGELTYGTQFDDNPLDELDETAVSVTEVLAEQRRFVYEYDFGDSWEHDVVVEDRSGTRLGLKFAVCLEGQNACPPEDCGGPSGYRAMIQALDDPNDEEHESYLRWVGGPFDPTYFEVAEANAALQRVR
jgi:hypothetical protein